ncbi:unnamed protein product [Alternaria alternata]
MSDLPTSAIRGESTVLVTGANGYLASHIVDKFLQHGLKVRGTVRDLEKSSWLVDLLEKRYGSDRFELTLVPDITREGAFEEAVKGVSAVVHVATIMTFDPNPDNVIPGAVAAAIGAMEAAAKEPTVKRFIFTSSSAAVVSPFAGNDAVLDEHTWNERAVEEAYKPPTNDSYRAWYAYAASKTRAEQAVWKWCSENHPSFITNAVLPNGIFGRVLDPVNQGYRSSAHWIPDLFEGKIEHMRLFPPQWFVDVEDVALLHVAAAILPHVKNERIFAFAEPFTFNKILSVLRKLYPTRSFIDDFSEGEDLTTIKPRARAQSMLRELGQAEWTSLERSVEKNLEVYIPYSEASL